MNKVGLVCVSVLGFHFARSLLKFVYNKWLAPICDHNANLKEMGRWAVITGSTNGLGKAFACACAKRGMDVVLISRYKDKLETVAAQIESEYKVNTKIIQADFTNLKNYFSIDTQLFGLDIGVLINNVTIGYSHPEYFLDVSDKNHVYKNIITCNIYSVTNMTHIVLPRMVHRGRGVIINISSITAHMPSPLLSVFGASKAYVEKFSKDLAHEYSNSGVIIQCLTPGYVCTRSSWIKEPTWLAPSAQQYVESALKTTGIEPITSGYFPHSLLMAAVGFVESVSPTFAAWIITEAMLSIRSQTLENNVM